MSEEADYDEPKWNQHYDELAMDDNQYKRFLEQKRAYMASEDTEESGDSQIDRQKQIQALEGAIKIQALEGAIKMLVTERAAQITCMRASIGLAILRRNLNVAEISEHFGVSPQRVRKVVKDVQGCVGP